MELNTYNTWHQFVRDANQTNDLNPSKRASRDTGRGDWQGAKTFEEAIHLATHGWPEGLRRIKDNVHIIERFVFPKQPRRELAYSVRGPGILDLERYQQGRPDSWLSWEERDQQDGMSTQIVPMIFNLSASSGVTAETLFRRGATVCALIDILEHSNIRVELTIVEQATYYSGGRYSHRDVGSKYAFKVTMKHSEDALDLDRVAFALCNASVLRRLMFSVAEQYVPNLPAGYGTPRTYKEDGAINIDSASLVIRDEKDMIPWLVKQLAGYGIEVQ